MKPVISLSPLAVQRIEKILNHGGAVSIRVLHEDKGTRLKIESTSSRTEYEVTIPYR